MTKNLNSLIFSMPNLGL